MSKLKSKRYILSLLGCLSLAAVAFSTALPTRAEAQGVCNGGLNIDYSPPGSVTVGGTKKVELIIGGGIITGGTANTIDINRVRYELDCNANFAVGVPCTDQGNIFRYVGDASITTTCGVGFTSNVPGGGFLTNEIVFTPSIPITIPANTPDFCELFFDVQLDNLEPLMGAQADPSPTQVEIAGGYNFLFNDAVCDNGGSSGQSQAGQIPIQGCGDGVVQPVLLFCNGGTNNGNTCATDVDCPNGGTCVQSTETCDPPGSTPTTPAGNTNTCTSTCTYCGDGIVQPGEQCDDAGPSATCTAQCTTIPICGDGAVNAPGETCDPPGSTPLTPPNNTNTCRANCTYCGDGVLDPGEACDTAGPSPTCTAQCTVPPSCGNGVLDPGETCDPPGQIQLNGNVCRADCTFCGDGIKNDRETCDPGANPSCTRGGVCRADCARCLKNDPAVVQIKAGNDRLWVHGRFEANVSVDPTQSGVGVRLTQDNPDGSHVVLFEKFLDGSKVTRKPGNTSSTVFTGGDSTAKTGATGGVSKVRVVQTNHWYRVTAEAWGDLSAATIPTMTVEVYFGSQEFKNSGTWKKTHLGWLIQK